MAETLRTACNRDCPDACSMLVTVENGSIRLRGDPESPITRGFLCYRTGRYDAKQRARNRLLQPLARAGGRQVAISWDDAFDRIEAELREVLERDGPAALCSVQTGGSLGIVKGVTDYFFRLLGPITEVTGDMCAGPGTAAQIADFGVCESHDLFDLENSRSIVLWGRNVGVSYVHHVPILKECRARGARILVIDPVPREAGLPGVEQIFPRPGRDLELALGVGRRLLESARRHRGRVELDHLDGYGALVRSRSAVAWAELAGVTPAELERIAEALLERPATLQVGWGLQRRARGGLTVRALDALGAVSGNLGLPGGGVSFYYWRRRAFRLEAFQTGRPPLRTIDQACLGEQILAARDPRIGFLWISCANPVASLPDSRTVARAIEETGFSVAVDTHETDTTRRASLVLPAATLLEHGDLLGAYGHHWLQMSRKVVEPPPGVRSDLEIIQELGRRFGLAGELAGSVEEWADRLLRPEVRAAGVTAGALKQRALRNPLVEPVLFADGKVPTATGNVQLITGADYVEPEREEPGFPLWVFSNSHRRAQSSQWVTDERDEGPMTARVHPDSAAGIPDGALARLVAPAGEVRVRLRHDRELRKDIVVTPKSGSMDLGRAINVLVPARKTDLGGGSRYLDLRVRLEAG